MNQPDQPKPNQREADRQSSPVDPQSTTADPKSSAEQSSSQVQGEGDYEGARRYRKDVEHFVATADIDKAAREAAPHDQREASELEAAEELGRSKARGGEAGEA